jgi:hypothetical protein
MTRALTIFSERLGHAARWVATWRLVLSWQLADRIDEFEIAARKALRL